jgi:hypothetical protein
MDTQTTQTTQVNPIEHFRREFVEGSGIAPELYAAAVQVRDELETDPYTHEALGWPIHEALGWEEPSRNYQTRKPHRFGAGAFLLQETGEVWQIKPLNPRLARRDGKNGFDRHGRAIKPLTLDADGKSKPETEPEFKPVKYETPIGAGSRACLPLIDPETFKKICDRLNLDHESARAEKESLGGFWAWVKAHPELPIIITEGGKKALCLLSHGYIAIALTGCWGAIQAKDSKGARLPQSRLIVDLVPFAVEGRPITIALDIDLKPKTRRDVWQATGATSWLLRQAGCIVTIARWDNAGGKCKGVDDLIVNCGIGAWEQALATARSAQELAILWRLQNPLGKYRASLLVNMPCLSAISPRILPYQGILCLLSRMGTGKTKLIRLILDYLKSVYPGVIAVGHRQTLQRSFSDRLDLDFLNDQDRFRGQTIGANGLPTKRLSLCWDSLLAVNPADYPPGSYVLVLDEVDQGFWHLLLGATCGKGGKRPALIDKAIELIRNAGLVVLASADITQKEIDFVCSIRNEQPFIVQNDYQPVGYMADFYMGDYAVKGSDRAAMLTVLSRLWESLKSGYKVWVAVDTLKLSKIIEQIALAAGIPADKILRFDGETSGNPEQRNFADLPNERAKDYQVIIHNSSLTSGVSIEVNHFQVVYGLFTGQTIAPWDCTQMLNRVRTNVLRVIYCRQTGKRSHLSKGRNHLQVSTDLLDRAALIAQSLGDDDLLADLDVSSPASTYVARAIADHNWAMGDFGLQVRLRLEAAGHEVIVNDPAETLAALEADKSQYRQQVQDIDARVDDGKAIIAECSKSERQAMMAELDAWRKAAIDALHDGLIGPYLMGVMLKAIDDEIKIADATRLHGRPSLAADEAKKLEDKTYLSFADQETLERFKLCDFYAITPDGLTVDDVQFDARGKTRRGLNLIEGLLWDGLALQQDREHLGKLRAWRYKLPAQDLPVRAMRADLMDCLEFAEVLERVASGEQWSADTPWVADFADRCKANPTDCHRAFGFIPHPSQTPCAILGMSLRAIGLKTKSRRLGTGDREQVYRVNEDHLDAIRGILSRRAEKHLEQGIQPRQHPLTLALLGGVDAIQEKMADWVAQTMDDAPDDAPDVPIDEEWAAEYEATAAA